MKFRKYGDNDVFPQTFDKEKITVTKCGQTYNVYDAIQAANIDTDIKEVLQKYHCTTEQAVEIMQQRGGIQGIYADISEIQEKVSTLADMYDFQDYVKKEFENLPIELRNKYGNNPEEFLKNAEKEIQQIKQNTETNNQKPEQGNNND